MNQKYLQGISTNMAGPDEAVFFEATPENISAFLSQHSMAENSAIGTVDDKTFLKARMGIIDVCLDQEYLRQTLLPVYSRVQTGELPAPPLRTVSKEAAQAEECPLPDWNFLRTSGYSDEKYQGIFSGEALLKLDWYGEKVPLEVQVHSYYSGGNLALELMEWITGEPEEWGTLTVNLGCGVEKDCAFIDVNNLGADILPWIEKTGLGRPTGRTRRSGFVEYPEYRFDAKRLQALDADGYRTYSQAFDQPNRKPPQRKKSGQER